MRGDPSGQAAGAGDGADLLVGNIGQLVDAEGPPSAPLTVIPDAALWIQGGRIAWRGPAGDTPPEARMASPRLDAGGGLVLPGLVDAHTHAVFGATREHELEARLAGATYQAIAAGGGGIAWSVRDLRGRDEDELVRLARPRLAAFLRHGVTTVEVKSGYGLTTAEELKILRAIQRLSEDRDLPHLVPTFLGAHAVPSEFAADRAAYVRLVCDEMLPAVVAEDLARFCDVFCDEGAFTLDESARILGCAAELGLGLKIHAEEFAPLGGAALAARLGAASADHLIAIDAAGIAAMAASGTVAVLLPGTSLFLRLGRHAPGRALLDAGATVALATDFNPGSSPTWNLPLVLALGCLNLGLTIPEAVRAVTRGAARAVGEPERGTLVVGAPGDLAVFAVPDVRLLVYHYGIDHAAATVRDGRVIWRRV